jgi:crotonobetainyl-CoA:carnitine CoA-transferase CaiB-like acyl-CoA transferase
LLVRERTGRGQRLEASLVQGLTTYDYFGTMTWQHVQRQTGNAAGSSAMASAAGGASRVSFTCPTSDGRWINFTHMLPNQAQALSRALGAGDTIDDPRFASQPLFATAEDAQEWEDRIWEALRTRPYAEWEPILLADGDIAFEMARRCEEGLDHTQIRHNGEAITVDDPDHGPIEQVGPVARFSETPARIERSAPRLGEHGGPFTRATLAGSESLPPHPLSGVTIVELGYFYAMPFAVTMAAALGARVIKLEGLAGDPMRTAFGVPEVPAVKLMEGKESLAVDLRTPQGREIVHKLVAEADVFMDGFRPGVADRLGLGRDDIRRLNPSILYVWAGGYGADGPYATRPIYAGVASALAGQVYRHAGYWLEPELTSSLDTLEAQTIVLPRLRGPVDGDANAASAVFSTLLLGLFARARHGIGQDADTSMIGGNAFAYADDFNRYRDKVPVPIPDAENFGINALYRVYRVAEGWVFLGAELQEEWEALATALHRSDLVDDDRFRTPEARAANDDALAEVIGSILATRPAAAWEQELSPKGVACVAAFEATNSEFTNTDPVLRETGLVVEVEHPIFGTVLRHGLPWQFSETPGRVAAGCTVGQHTDEILRGAGYSADDVATLRAAKVVG